MREVKFRGKRKDSGEWVWGFYFRTGVNRHYIKSHSNLNDYEVDPETVSQYIGIKDMFGNDIYEKDILQSEDDKGTVVWNENELGYRLAVEYGFKWFIKAHPYLKNFEIIGNTINGIKKRRN